MSAIDNNTGARGLRLWWLSPPRTGLRRLISPWEYRHLRACGFLRIVGGICAAAAGVICLAYRGYGWAAFFLAVGALALAGGWWYVSIAPSGPHRT